MFFNAILVFYFVFKDWRTWKPNNVSDTDFRAYYLYANICIRYFIAKNPYNPNHNLY